MGNVISDSLRSRRYHRWLWSRFSVRRIVHNPTRAVIVVVSIALATALWSAVATVSLASINSFEEELGLGADRFVAIVAPVGGRFAHEEIGRCFSLVSSRADMLFIRREPGVLRLETGSRAVSVAGLAGFGSFVPKQRGLSANEAGLDLSPKIRQELNLRDGDPCRLQVAGSELSFTVGKVEDDALREVAADVVLPLSDLGAEPIVDTVLLRPRYDQTGDLVGTVSRPLRECLGAQRPIRVERVEAPIARADNLLKAYRLNLAIMAAITLLVCGLLISQSAHIALRGVLRELSVLRTLGMSTGECFGFVVSEGALLSLGGALAGRSLGYPLIVWLTGFLLNTASEIYHVDLNTDMHSSAFSLSAVAIVLAMTVCGALSAALGARSVLSLAPYRGTRREGVHNQPLSRSSSVWLAATGVLASFFSLALPYVYPSASGGYLAVMGVVWSGVACVPFALRVMSQYSLTGAHAIASRFARGALVTAGRHFVLGAFAACVAMALMTGLSLMVSSFHGTLVAWSATRLSGDLFVSTAISGAGNEGRIEAQHLEQIRGVPGIKNLVPYYETDSDVGSSAVVVGGVNIKAQCERRVYNFTSGACVAGDGGWQGRALISEGAARKLGLSQGSTLILASRRFVVQGIMQEFGTEQPLIVINDTEFLASFPRHNPKTITIDLSDPSRISEARTLIEKIAPLSLVVRDNQQLLNLVDTLFRRTFRITESVRWIVFVLAILGLVSTSAQYLWERRRDFKTASVIGVGRATLTHSFALEAVYVAGSAALIGTLSGICVGWCLTEYINPLVFGWSLSFSLSWSPFADALFLVAGVAILSWLVGWRMIGAIQGRVSLADE